MLEHLHQRQQLQQFVLLTVVLA